MGLNYDCIVAIYANVRHKRIKNPGKWLGDLVFNTLREYDDSLERDSLIIETKSSEDTEGRLIDVLHLECENFRLDTDCDEDGDRLLAAIMEKMKKRLDAKGATGSVNVYGYQMDRPPEISSFGFLTGPREKVAESAGFCQAA